ncbi:hypothetical protein [Synechocystis sp. LKSZ1]|uniref:hypothetical protein n=1 Tax=Synechocystis sp. LKSZ1 TaxID=3144951 RepID=UPI00336BB6C8
MALTATQINAAYLKYLGRPADTAGQNFWVGVSNQGTPDAEIINSIRSSEEALNYQITQIYVSYWGRAADPQGLEFWVNNAQAAISNGASAEKAILDVTNFFAESTEAEDEYGFLRNPNTSDRGAVEQFVNQIYVNAFNRNAEAAGLKFWSDVLQANPSFVGEFIQLVVNGAQNDDAITIRNRNNVALDFTNKFNTLHNSDPFTDSDATSSIQVYGPAAGETSQDIIRSVTAQDSTVTAAKAATDAFMAAYLEPVYSLQSTPTNSVNEGQSIAFTLDTTYVAPGTVLTYQIAPTGGITTADIVGGQLTGTIVVGNDGTAAISVNIALDALIEGNEQLTLNILNQANQQQILTSRTVTVNEVLPTYTLTASSAQVSEGGTVTFTLVTSAPVQPNTTFNYQITGVQAADVNVPLAGTVTTDANGQAVFSVNIAQDAEIETETLSFSIAGKSADVSIVDVPPSYSLTSDVNTVPEGGTVIFNFETSNPAQAGATFNYTITGVQAEDIVGGVLTGQLTTDASGKATLQLDIARDVVIDTENLTLTVQAPGTATGTISDSVAITNVEPGYSLTSDVNTVPEGGTVIFNFETSNPAQAGATFNYTITGVQAEDIVGGVLTGQLTTDASGKATLQLDIARDVVIDTENLTLTVQAPGTATGTISDSVAITNVEPGYSLTSDVNTVPEGGTVIFNFETSNPAQAGATFNYTITGVQAEDIVGGVLTGQLTTDASGKATLQLDIARDVVIDPENLTLTVQAPGTATGTISDSVAITNVEPGYSLTSDVSTVDEGGTVIFTFQTSDPVQAGATFNYTITGVQAEDIVGGVLTGQLTTDASGQATLQLGIARDIVIDPENLTLTVQAPGTATGTISDSVAITNVEPGYSLTSDVNTVDEGGTVIFTFQTSDPVQAGATFNYTITGVQAEDIVGGQLTGVLTTDASGQATLQLGIARDIVIDPENLTLTVQAPGTATGTISDSVAITNVEPGYSLTSDVNTVDEGGTVIFTFQTSDPVQAGATFNYTITGVQTEDIVGGVLTGQLTTDASGKATLQLDIAYDAVVEGLENLTLTVQAPGTAAGTIVAQVPVIDIPPVYTMVPDKTSILEGETVVFTFETSQPLQPNTTFSYQLLGIDQTDVAGGVVAGTFTTDESGRYELQVTLLNDVNINEGDETLTVRVATPSGFFVSEPVTVVNVLPEYTLTANTAQVSEGGTIIFTFTSNLPVQANTSFSYKITGIDASDIVGGSLEGQLVTDINGVANLQIQVAQDAVIDPGEALTLTVTTPLPGQPAPVTVDIIDVPPVYTLTANKSAVQEGQTVTFTFSTINPVQPNTQFAYTITGISALDIVGGATAGNLQTDANGIATFSVTLAPDVIYEPDEENLIFTVFTNIGEIAAEVNIIDVEPAPIALTPGTDIGTSSLFIGNENTLGQGDQLTGWVGYGFDRLQLFLSGTFNIGSNFTTNDIEIFELNGGGSDTQSSIYLGNSTGIELLQIIRTFGDVLFADIYNNPSDVANSILTVYIKDSEGAFEFNFDATYLQNNPFQEPNVLNIIVDEIPVVDEAGFGILSSAPEGIGIFVSQGAQQADAQLEILNLTSINTSSNPETNYVNTIAFIDSGPAMRTLNIDGDTSLHIVADLGGDNPSGNPGLDQPYLTTIDASGLNADLKFTYTSKVGDATVPGRVSVTLAQGNENTAHPFELFDNIVDLDTYNAGAQATGFDVVAPETSPYGASNDSVETGNGNDTIDVGGGYNYVDAGNGNNIVTADDGYNLIKSGSGNDNITVGDGNEVPKPAAKLLQGPFAGNDFVKFDNIIDAGEGNNNVTAGDGDNFITTGDGNDTVNAGNGNNVIYVGDGNNVVNAGVGQVPFGTGTNKVIAGNGIDIVNTGDGPDTIVVGDETDFAPDIVKSNGGADLVITGNGNDFVESGSGNDNVAVGTGNVNVNLGQGSDALWMRANDMNNLDFVNGGTNDTPLSYDQIIFTAGGSIELTETIRVSNIEQFTLRNLSGDEEIVSTHPDVQAAFEGTIAGAQQDYFINVSNELIAQSNDNLNINGSNARRFTIDSREARANTTVDITNVDDILVPTDPSLLSAFRFLGGADDERLIVRGVQVSDLLTAQLDGGYNVIEIVDGVTIQATDLQNVSGIDRFELSASNNSAQTFNITLTDAILAANPGLIIGATNALPPGSRLNVNVTGVTAGASPKVIIEKSSNVIVTVIGDPGIGGAGAKTQVVDGFFLTSNADDINGTTGADTIVADSVSDFNSSDDINGGGGFDTLRMEFGVNNAGLQFVNEFAAVANTNSVQINGYQCYVIETPTTAQFAIPLGEDLSGIMIPLSGGSVSSLALEPIVPGAFPGFLFGLPLLTQPLTAVTNFFTSPVAVDPDTFDGIRANDPTAPFASSSQPDVPQGLDPDEYPLTLDNLPANYPTEGIGFGALPFPGAAQFQGATLESALNFATIDNIEKFVFNPPNDNGVRFVGFNTQETFETLQSNQLASIDLVSLEILQTYDVDRAPNAGNISALIEGNGAPLNDILYLDDFSWNTAVTTKAEAYWAGARDNYVVDLVEFINPINDTDFFALQEVDYDFSRYEPVDIETTNDFVRGKLLNSAGFALEVNTGAGNDFIRRDTFGENGNTPQPFGYLRQAPNEGPGPWANDPNLIANVQDVLDLLAQAGRQTGSFILTGNIADYKPGETAYLDLAGNVVSDNVRNNAPNPSDYLPFFVVQQGDINAGQWMLLTNGNISTTTAVLVPPEVGYSVSDTDNLGGYLVDSGSGDDVVLLDGPNVNEFGIPFVGINVDQQFAFVPNGPFSGNWFVVFPQGGLVDPFGRFNPGFPGGSAYFNPIDDQQINPSLYGLAVPGYFADDVVLTRSGNDYIVDYGGDNVVYSGIGNDFVLTGLGNDFIVSDDDDELDSTNAESEAGKEDFSGPASVNGTDNDVILADGPLLQSFFQVSFERPFGDDFTEEDLFSSIFGKDYVRDLQGDNIISTGGNDDTVLTGAGNDIILAGTFTELDEEGFSRVDDSDVVIDLGGNNLIVTLGDDDYVRVGDSVGIAAAQPGANIIVAGFGNDNDVVISNGNNTDWIEIAGGQDYVDAGAGNDLISMLLSADSTDLDLNDGSWSGLSTGDTLLGGDGVDNLLFALGGGQDDIIIAPRTVSGFGAEGQPVSLNPADGTFPYYLTDTNNIVNPIMDSIEAFTIFSDDADVYLAQGVAQQAGGQITVFLNDLNYDGIGSGVDILLSAQDFASNETLNAYAFNIGASSLQNGINASAGLIGGDGDDKLSAGFILQQGILPGGGSIAQQIDAWLGILDNQALDNFLGADVEVLLNSFLGDFADQLVRTGLQPSASAPPDVPPITGLREIFTNYPLPGENRVAQIQALLDSFFFDETLGGDFVEDYITYQGNGGADTITLEPTVFFRNALTPIIVENTPEFVRYTAFDDGAAPGASTGFDQVFNFNKKADNIPNGVDGSLTFTLVGGGTSTLTGSTFAGGVVADATSTIDSLTGDKIVLGNEVDYSGANVPTELNGLGDFVSKNSNQLIDLFKINQAVNFSTGRQTVYDANGRIGRSGDEALFFDQAQTPADPFLTNIAAVANRLSGFIYADNGDGGLVVVNANGGSGIYRFVQLDQGNNAAGEVLPVELSLLAIVRGTSSTTSLNLRPSDFIIDNTDLRQGTIGGDGTEFLDNIFPSPIPF